MCFLQPLSPSAAIAFPLFCSVACLGGGRLAGCQLAGRRGAGTGEARHGKAVQASRALSGTCKRMSERRAEKGTAWRSRLCQEDIKRCTARSEVLHTSGLGVGKSLDFH